MTARFCATIEASGSIPAGYAKFYVISMRHQQSEYISNREASARVEGHFTGAVEALLRSGATEARDVGALPTERSHDGQSATIA
jgi:hypothetical protein